MHLRSHPNETKTVRASLNYPRENSLEACTLVYHSRNWENWEIINQLGGLPSPCPHPCLGHCHLPQSLIARLPEHPFPSLFPAPSHSLLPASFMGRLVQAPHPHDKGRCTWHQQVTSLSHLLLCHQVDHLLSTCVPKCCW